MKNSSLSSLILLSLALLAVAAVPNLLAADDISGANLLPNPGFARDEAGLEGWKLVGCQGQKHDAAFEGNSAVSVVGSGSDHGYWRTEDLSFEPGGLYEFVFQARRAPGSSGGCAVAGPSRVNRDFGVGTDWGRHGFVFVMPHDSRADYVRFGQWQAKGEMFFARPLLRRAMASHVVMPPGVELGEAEWIAENRYHFAPDYNWRGANYHRPLLKNRAGFNSNRWLFSPGAEVIYHHQVGSFPQRNGKLSVQINHHVEGVLRVDASVDGSNWVKVADFDGQRRGGTVDLPKELFPTREVFVRLAQNGDGAGFQVNVYNYEAALEGKAPEGEGSTIFIATTKCMEGLAVRALPRSARSLHMIQMCLTNLTSKALWIGDATWRTERGGSLTGKPAKAAAHHKGVFPFYHKRAPGKDSVFWFDLKLDGGVENAVYLALHDTDGRTLWSGESTVQAGMLEDASYGYWLAEKDGLTVWWCESGWKVGRTRPAPSRPSSGRTTSPVRITAARGEYEAAQVVLQPSRDVDLMRVEVGPWRAPLKANILPTVRIEEVAYVHVTHPTDDTCVRGWYPDPLPPLKTPLSLKSYANQPLWLTFWVPGETVAGDYKSSIKLRTTAGDLEVPLVLHVYDFELPRETHLRSALGLGAGAINAYHKLANEDDKLAVFEKYLRNFAEHRISPYSFYDFAPIDVRFVGEGTNARAVVDFSKFDPVAERWLGKGGFNSFVLSLRGMGGGTFHSRHLGNIAGYEEGTPEHARLFKDYLGQIEAHLRQRGWIDKAFTYWFDEPDPKDYEFVVDGMKRLKDAAPGIKRMLTEQPEKELIGHVDIWCALTPEWTRERVRERQRAGEEVWWYICTGPKAPYVTEFIDHPGTELRLWPWQSWQYGVNGILIWATIYWNSPVAYPPPQLQDPWKDPMSWVSGYGTPVGTRNPWGNGDGRFLYPPRRDPNVSSEPCLDGPINSIRWENLRDGMEDYEYFWLLKQRIERTQTGRESSLVKQARKLLEVPEDVSRDLTHFTVDPRKMLEHRALIAEMIEKLSD
ncbi:MAG: DUF4091 domain-containing protein [Verrucomicrobiota bacterium]|nr:DUF4091 domain-containing protein [Verrucomicrobiota bacterium]